MATLLKNIQHRIIRVHTVFQAIDAAVTPDERAFYEVLIMPDRYQVAVLRLAFYGAGEQFMARHPFEARLLRYDRLVSGVRKMENLITRPHTRDDANLLSAHRARVAAFWNSIDVDYDLSDERVAAFLHNIDIDIDLSND